jgi:hypothetical protein
LVKKKKCSCGIVISQVKRWPDHVASRWHRGYRKALDLRRRGVPLKEIGYQLGGLTASYVAQRFKGLR